MKKILIIEDNEQNMYLTAYLLESNGYEVVQAWNGQQGLELATAQPPDLVLLDIQLPEIDGYEVARQLRQLDTFAEIPIVAVTSHAMAGDREAALAAGCTGYIEKPIDPTGFLEEVHRHLAAASPQSKEPS